MCSVFVMLFDKSRYLIELFTQNASALVPGGVRLVYKKGSLIPGMRKFRIDQDFLIEHCHMIYIMPVVFAEIYF